MNLRSDPDPSVPVIAVIGCGAISEASHIPSLARLVSPGRQLVLVDSDLDRAQRLQREWGARRAAADYHEVIDEIDGAVVAVPPRLHAPIALDCIQAGVHVLCEKPLAEDPSDATSLVAAADRAGVTLAVNNKRRLFGSSVLVKEILDRGDLGTPLRLEYHQGAPFDWPAASDSYFGIKAGGRGVLADLGAHVVDLACWWLGGKPELTSYEDDWMGGTEAVAKVSFEKDKCQGLIHLSWLTRLRNTYRIVGDRATVEGVLYDDHSVTLVTPNGERRTVRSKHTVDATDAMTESLLASVRQGARPAVPASEVVPSIQLIHQCYEARKRCEMPWYADATKGGAA